MIRLHRNVVISAFDLEGVIARSQERPELLAVARLAYDHPRGLTADILAGELIGGQSILCRRIIDRCVSLQVLERQRVGAPARLTELGRAMLERGQIWIPERGTWRVYFAEDPLLDVPLVHVEPCWTPKANAARSEVYRQKKQGGRPARAQARPALLRNFEYDTLCSSLVDGSTFQLLELSKHGAYGQPSTLHLGVGFPADGHPRVTLSGELEAPPRPPKVACRPIALDRVLELPSALAAWRYEDLWTELVSFARDIELETLAAACERAKRPVLPVTLEQTSASERRSMRTRVEVPPLEFARAGCFEANHLDRVELIPQSTEDADRWARWLQWDSLDGYRVPAQLERSAATIRERFPLFQVSSATPHELLARAKSDPTAPSSRYLLTTADLGLWS
ncbi:hypothetical protein PPSIR1_38399 [Plesiocystis pacifica SIR-1]|uniref:Uncharacterized protein n=1 Tax=Plesiocystis pacifica SIR-1 TaxID=391625 RepID=A6G8K3_9BACT|nr:hypothetical protein PPSIR1_38399 [Plesiocystis pacifica SIR-1]